MNHLCHIKKLYINNRVLFDHSLIAVTISTNITCPRCVTHVRVLYEKRDALLTIPALHIYTIFLKGNIFLSYCLSPFMDPCGFIFLYKQIVILASHIPDLVLCSMVTMMIK